MEHPIREEMRVQPTIDPALEVRRRIAFIKTMLQRSGTRSLVLGISGGVDSSTCGKLAQLAVDELNQGTGTEQYQFIAVRLPYGEQKDEDEAQLALSFIQPSKIRRFGQCDNLVSTAHINRYSMRCRKSAYYQQAKGGLILPKAMLKRAPEWWRNMKLPV